MMALPGTPRRITRYVGRAFLAAFAVTLFAVCALYLVVDGAQQVQAGLKAGRHEVFAHLVRYYARQLPVIFVQIGPVVTLVGAAFALTTLRRQGELLPVFAAGVSLQRVLRPVLVVAAALAGVTLALEQWVTPYAAASVREAGLSTGREAQIFNLLVEDADAGLVVFCGKYTPARACMENVHIFELAPDTSPDTWRIRGRAFAWEARFDGRQWVLRDGYRVTYDRLGDRRSFAPIVEAPFHNLTLLPYDVEHGAELGVSLGGAMGLGPRASLDALWRATRAFDGPAAPRVHLHARIAHAFAHLALLLAGLPLVLRRESRAPILGTLMAGLVCALYFLLQAVCFDLGVRGWIPPALAGWAPVAILGAVGLNWFDALPS